MKNRIILITLIASLSSVGDALAKDTPSFKDADKNGDGKISQSEFSSVDQGRKGTESTSQMFAKIDTDSDKSISPTEFAPYRIRRDMEKKPAKKEKPEKKKKD